MFLGKSYVLHFSAIFVWDHTRTVTTNWPSSIFMGGRNAISKIAEIRALSDFFLFFLILEKLMQTVFLSTAVSATAFTEATISHMTSYSILTDLKQELLI